MRQDVYKDDHQQTSSTNTLKEDTPTSDISDTLSEEERPLKKARTERALQPKRPKATNARQNTASAPFKKRTREYDEDLQLPKKKVGVRYVQPKPRPEAFAALQPKVDVRYAA